MAQRLLAGSRRRGHRRTRGAGRSRGFGRTSTRSVPWPPRAISPPRSPTARAARTCARSSSWPTTTPTTLPRSWPSGSCSETGRPASRSIAGPNPPRRGPDRTWPVPPSRMMRSACVAPPRAWGRGRVLEPAARPLRWGRGGSSRCPEGPRDPEDAGGGAGAHRACGISRPGHLTTRISLPSFTGSSATFSVAGATKGSIPTSARPTTWPPRGGARSWSPPRPRARPSATTCPFSTASSKTRTRGPSTSSRRRPSPRTSSPSSTR